MEKVVRTLTITEKAIKESLVKQLELQQKKEKFYMDLVNDYMILWKIKKMLQKDILEKGIHYYAKNGNGKESEKTNDSIKYLTGVTATMLKILTDLKLKDPTIISTDEDDYL